MSWPELVADHTPLVWRTITRLLDDVSDCEDVFQETFAAAVRLDRRETVRSWPATLTTLATARAIDRLRTLRRRRERSAEADAFAAHGGDPSDRAVATELATQLREALATLPAEQAEVFALATLSDWSHRKIGERFGKSENAIAATVSRVRRHLREVIQDD